MNWKTTVAGLIAGLPQLINAITPLVPPKYAALVSAVGVVLMGVLAKDFNVSGTK